MNKPKTGEMKRGQTISFRVPSDTPDHLVKHLQKLKETERRNFSSKIAEFVMDGVGKSFSRERETITIPLPNKLSKSQRDWLKHEHSEALIGNIIYQLLADPVRSTALLASMNSKSVDINEALYLQEDHNAIFAESASNDNSHIERADASNEFDEIDDDLDAFEWNTASREETEADEPEETEEDLDDLLGDFLAKMNK